MSLKYGLNKYPACMYFVVTGKCVPLSTFLCIILIPCQYQFVLVNFCTRLPVLTIFFNSQGFWKNDLSGL